MALNQYGLVVPSGSDTFDPDGDIRDLAESLGPVILLTVPTTVERDNLDADDDPRVVFNIETGLYEARTGSSTWESVATVVDGTYTPDWGVLAGGSTPSVGAGGSRTGGFTYCAGWVDFWAQLTLGTGFAVGSGSYTIGLPTAPAAGRWMFTGSFRSSTSYPIYGEMDSGNCLLRLDPVTAGGNLRSAAPTVPVNWASGHSVFLSGRYKHA